MILSLTQILNWAALFWPEHLHCKSMVPLVISLFTVYLTSVAAGEWANVSLPVHVSPKVSDHCLSLEERTSVLSGIRTEVNKLTQNVHSDYPPCCSEGGTGWVRVAYYNMSNTSHNCPENLVLYETPKRSCGQGLHFEGCLSTSFSVGRSYNKVCGRITGYQYGPTTAFYQSSNNIDSRYINGVSLTYGSSPRRHIWSFAAALGTSYGQVWNCRCTSTTYTNIDNVPTFVNDSYFCETGTSTWTNMFYSQRPLWDGKGCASQSVCCDFNNPPWFCRGLPESTTDDIEMRLCSNYNRGESEDTPLELIELYIK